MLIEIFIVFFMSASCIMKEISPSISGVEQASILVQIIIAKCGI